jgi:hypothetical protein
MAKANAQKTRLATKPYATKSVTGNYAFRFSGYTMDANDTLYHLAGIGLFSLDGAGKLTGSQTSSTTAMTGQSAVHKYCQYTLSGTYTINGNGTGIATIDFNPTTAGCTKMTGYFDLVVVGSDRFWFMSTKEVLSDGSIADEVVSGEAQKN